MLSSKKRTYNLITRPLLRRGVPSAPRGKRGSVSERKTIDDGARRPAGSWKDLDDHRIRYIVDVDLSLLVAWMLSIVIFSSCRRGILESERFPCNNKLAFPIYTLIFVVFDFVLSPRGIAIRNGYSNSNRSVIGNIWSLRLLLGRYKLQDCRWWVDLTPGINRSYCFWISMNARLTVSATGDFLTDPRGSRFPRSKL